MFGVGNSVPGKGWRKKLFIVIFGADTKWGKFFDVTLIISITASVLVVMLDSIASLRVEYGDLFKTSEWVFTVLFTIEYV
jgi:voltage-gated potassium channel